MRFHFHRLERQSRLVSMAIAIGIGVLFAVAVCLQPDGKGYGTHQQLGLPECQFLKMTGWKCPQCGMTTSFAYTVRGQAVQAWNANPCGPILAIALAVIFPWCLVAGFAGRSLLIRHPGIVIAWMTGMYFLVTTAFWLVRLTL